MKQVIRHLRRAALLSVEEGPSDAQLLESFLVRRDEVAFEALLRRHGPMVLGVCQRVLRNVHDAEDALQATFLVLARKASSIRSKQVVASWLYGVAYRTAMKARVMNAKRRMKERQAGEMARSQSSSDEELLEKLDHELNRLPDKYRVPVVLCELEGRSRKEAARMLEIPEGTLSWRLAQAKKLLAKRLSTREQAIPLGALAVGLSPTLRASTLKTVLTAGAVPAKVLALAEGVIKAMLLTKLKITACAAALMVVAGVGVSGLTYRATAQSPQPRETLVSRSQADDLDALRLEMEALRKELRATKERVKTLEDEVRGQKSKSTAQALQKQAQQRLDQSARTAQTSATAEQKLQKQAQQRLDQSVRGRRVQEAIEQIEDLYEQKQVSKLLLQAQRALKKLDENTDDKQAAELLEQALIQLKERERQKEMLKHQEWLQQKEREKQISSGLLDPNNPVHP